MLVVARSVRPAFRRVDHALVSRIPILRETVDQESVR